jgi:hypothetical protein
MVAKGWIEEEGWVVLSLESQALVSAQDYQDDAEKREYFEQALMDEEVFVFYTFPENDDSQEDGQT